MAERRFKASLLFLAVLALGIVWVVGLGQATPEETVTIANASYAQTETPEVTTEKPKRETLYQHIKLLDGIAFRVAQSYMEDIDPQELTRAGIDGMLEILDPFSVLMELKYYTRLMETTHGRYEGLGMSIDMRDDTITIVAPMEGTPAMRVGLQAGDKVVEIDGESTEGMTTEDASKKMRGPAGTSVVLTIARFGIPQHLEFEVERAVIELNSVPYYGMADEENKIGYLRLSKFSETTRDELRAALTELKNNDLKGLIFDLRGNGGGLLEQAVETASLFLEDDKLVVYTQGKDPRSQKRYYTVGDPLYPDKPLVILVDGATASASEIVSGAVQDWDRGLIVGNTTFGKGLVQQIFSLPNRDDVRLKLTTAKYYVPSGRCIQKPHMSKKHPDPDDEELVEDTEDPIYKTGAGREVYGGGGIAPDVLVERRSYAPIEVNLLRQSMYFNFAVDYVSNHPNITNDFAVTGQILDDFANYLDGGEFAYKTAMQVQLEEIEEILAEDSTKHAIFSSYLEELRSLVEEEKDAEFVESQEDIRRSLRGAILRNALGERGWYEGVVLRDDPYVQRALTLLKDHDSYRDVLAADHVKDETSNQ